MACSAFGQIDPPSSADSIASSPAFLFGAFGAFGPGLETANLIVPPFCGTFSTGSSTGWEFGGLFEFPITSSFAIQLRASGMVESGELREPVPGDNPVRLDDGTIANAGVDQVLVFQRTTIGIAALARLMVAGKLHAHGGLMAGRIVSVDQTLKQVAITPEQLLFVNGQRELELLQGRIFARSPMIAGITAGIGYDLPISRRSTLTPEITASFPIISHTTAGGWRPLALRIGASLRIGIAPAEIPPPDTTPQIVPPLLLATSITTQPCVVAVRIDEYDSTEVLPLLNRIFFAERSADLRGLYRQITAAEADTFTNARLLGSALDVYYHILNIVGRRMRETPDATLTINGYRNGRENDQALGRNRAEAVRRYLMDIWKIPGGRLKVSGRGLPPNPSRETISEGFEENARVELVPSDPNILAPVFRRHIQRIATPPAITFHIQTTAEAGVDHWELVVEDDSRERWRTFGGRIGPPDSIVWDWRSDRNDLPGFPMRLDYTLTVTDSTGAVSSNGPAAIDVSYQSVQQKLEYSVRDTTIENFSILLFNFDSPKVSQSDTELLQAIAAGVRPGANMRFTGYTDSLGDARHNQDLATARATEAASITRSLVPPNVDIVVDDSGGEWERFPYTTPEGRSHCRTVVIEIRTPKSE